MTTRELSEPIIKLLKSKKLLKYFSKFTGTERVNGKLYLIGLLNNKHKIKFATPDGNDIFIIPYDQAHIPLRYDNKTRHKYIEILDKFLQATHEANKGDTCLYVLKFYYDTVEYLSSKFNGYDMDYLEESNIKVDIYNLLSALDGYGKTAAYKQIMKDYHGVIL